MAVNEFSLDAIEQRRMASAGIAASYGVAPEQAASAIKNAPLAGVPASVGMHTPTLVEEASANRRQQDAIVSSPAVAKWAATVDPAHLAVSKDDFASLAKLSEAFKYAVGNPIEDISSAMDAAAAMGKRGEQSFAQGDYLKSVGQTLGGTVSALASFVAPLNQYIKRSIEFDPSNELRFVVIGADGRTGLGPVLVDPADRAARAQELADFATMAIFGMGRPGLPAIKPGASSKALVAAGADVPPPRPAPPPPPGVSPRTDTARTFVAEVDAKAVSAVQAEVAASQTFVRSPAVMESFIAQETGGQVVRVDPDTLIALKAEGHNPFPEYEAAIVKWAEAGEMLEVPLARYLAQTSGQPFAEQLNATTIFRDGSVSVEEAKELPKPVEVEATAPVEASPDPFADYSDDIADFDGPELENARALATESKAAVEQVVAAQRLRELFAEPKAVDSTKTNFARYNTGIEAAIADATRRMTQRAVAQVRSERLPEFKQRLMETSALVEQEFFARPDIMAGSYLLTGQHPSGAPLDGPVKLNREAVVAAIGETRTAALPQTIFASDNFVDPEVAADLFGYSDVGMMIADLENLLLAVKASGAKDLKAYVKLMVRAQARNLTLDELGYDNSPEAIYAAASEAINTPKIVEFLAQDLQDFATENNLPFDKAAVKSYAAERFEQRQVKEAINLRKLESFVNRDARKLETALLAGDIPAAFRWKQTLFMHQLELVQAHKFLKVYNRAGKNIKVWAKKRSMPSMAQEFLNRIHQLLIVHGVPTKRDEGELLRGMKGQTFESFVETARDNGIDLVFYNLPPLPVNQLSVSEFQMLNEMLVALAVNGRAHQSVLADGSKLGIEEAVAEAYAGAGGVPNKPLDRSVGSWKPPLGGLRQRAKGLDAEHRILESMFDYMDGNNVRGVHNRVLQDGATDAANTVDRLQNMIYEPIIAKFKEIPHETRRTYNTKIDNTVLLDPRDGTPVVLRRGDLLAILANMGTAANRAKLAEGYGTTEDDIFDLLNDHLTKPEAEWVQFVWNQLSDVLFPLADANARAMRGYGLTKEQPLRVPLEVGDLPGGYFPLAYDPKFIVAPEPGDPSDPSAPLVKPFRPLTTPTGFEQDRTDYRGPLSLSLDRTLKDHMRDVFVRIGYGEYIQSARRFVTDSRIKQLWIAKLGREFYDLLIPWLEYQVFDVGLPRPDARGSQGLMRKLRQNLTLTSMGFSHSVGMSQILGSIPVISEIGPVRYVDGVKSFVFSAVTGRLNTDLYDKSEEMKYRHYNLEQNVRDVHEEMNQLDVTASDLKRFYKGWADASMKYINFMDKWSVSGAAWMGAYRKARFDLAMSEGDAIRYADKIVRKTQGTGRPKDLPAVQRPNNEFQRIWTFAYTWPGRYYNLLAEAGRAFNQGRFIMGSRKAYWLLFILPIVVAVKDGDLPDEDDDPEDWLFWMIRKMTLGLIGNMTFTRDAANFAERKMSGKQAGPGGTPLTRLIEAGGQAVKFDQKGVHLGKSNRVKAWANVMGLLGIIPGGGGQIGKTGQFLSDVNSKKAKPKTFGDWYEGLTSGRVEK